MTMDSVESILRQFTGGNGVVAPPNQAAPQAAPRSTNPQDRNANGVPDNMETINLKVQRPVGPPRAVTQNTPAANTVPNVGNAVGVTQGMRNMGQAAYEAYQQRIQQQTANTANQNLTSPRGENAFNIVRFARTPQGQEAIRAVIEKIRAGSGSPAIGNALERILGMGFRGNGQANQG